ncbi:hypothetical protein ACO0RG_001682 [Hanseniaspora osmophila]|uniref:non-specific serine/threonine protein kinase n=1 Tax=Hanseniaspora osmophila TaxID=56408 RepID=A0A1E5RH66_9ASCO|nr:Serine/threonine-protein kinase GIN4 [Hanseniaspora osmophila]
MNDVQEQHTRQNETTTNNPTTHSKHVQNTSSQIGPWKMGKTLGFGSSGKVRMAINTKTHQHAAVKIVSKSLFTKSQTNTSTIVEDQDNDFLPYGIEREIIIMKLLNHPNVLRLYDVWETDTDLYMVLEYVERGELFNLLVEQGPLGEKEAVRFFRQIIIGISYCHALGIVHRDLKPENLLLDHKLNIKIADFGMAALETKDKLLETSCGSPHYAAPEIVSGMPYHGFESDVWSCGVILYALLTGRLPFDEEDGNIRKLLLKVQKGKFSMPSNISPDARDLLSKILTVDAKQRIGTREILKHPLLKKYPNMKDSKSIKNLPREDTYLNPLANGGSENIDQSILNNLIVLWHGKKREEIVKSLKDPGANLEKTFYALLYNFKINVQLQNQLSSSQEELEEQKKQQKSQQHGQSNHTQQDMPKAKTPSPQKQQRLSVYQNQQQQQQQSAKQPQPQQSAHHTHSHRAAPGNGNSVSPPKQSGNTKKRLSTISVSSSHRRPISFIKPNGTSSSSHNLVTTSSSSNSTPSAHSLGSTPVKRTVTTSSHSASSSMDSVPPVPRNLLESYTSSTPNTSLTDNEVSTLTVDNSTSTNDTVLTQGSSFENRSSSPVPTANGVASGHAPSVPVSSIVSNPKRISRTISKRFSRSGSRASLYGGTGSNGSYGTLINPQTKLKHGSITTKLIATYAKLSELQDEEWGYIEQETRRTSQTFATLIDEVFEYEKHEQIRKEKLELQRKLKESKLREEQEKLQKQRDLLEQEKQELKIQEEQERLVKKKQISRDRLQKMEQKKRELEKMIARLREGIDGEADNSDDHESVSNKETDDLTSVETADNDRETETGPGEEEQMEKESESGFKIEDYGRQSPTEQTQPRDDAYELNGYSEGQNANTEKRFESGQENVNNYRSISEPTPAQKRLSNSDAFVKPGATGKHSALDNNILRSTQKRSFSLNTRPVSRLDPGLAAFEDHNNRNSRISAASQRKKSFRKSTISTVEESESGSDYDNDNEDDDDDEGYTTIIDEDEVERRIVESLRRSKFLGSQFDLAMKLAGGNNVSAASKRKSILKPNNHAAETIVAHGGSKKQTKSKAKNSKKTKKLESKQNKRGMLSASSSMTNLAEKSEPLENMDSEMEPSEGHTKLSEVTVPEVTRKSNDQEADKSHKSSVDKKRLSVLSLYSTKQSYRDLAAELKNDTNDTSTEKLENPKPATSDEEQFVFDDNAVQNTDSTAQPDEKKVQPSEQVNQSTVSDGMVQSRSSQVRLNFADRFKAKQSPAIKQEANNNENKTDEEVDDTPVQRKVELPTLPPLDKSSTHATGLGLVSQVDSTKPADSLVKDAESASANVTEPLVIDKNTNRTTMNSARPIENKETSASKPEPMKSIPKKKSGIFRLFSSPTKEAAKETVKNENNTKSSFYGNEQQQKNANQPAQKPSSSAIVHGDSFVKIICNAKSPTLSQLKLLNIIYEKLCQWERSKVGLKNVKMNSRQYLIRGKISNDNILSLRSTTFQILCSIDTSRSHQANGANAQNIIIVNKLSGSNKTFHKFTFEFENFLKNQDIVR